MKNREKKACARWRYVLGDICDKKMPININYKIYKKKRSNGSYGICFAVKKTCKHKPHATAMRTLIWARGKAKEDHVYNEDSGGKPTSNKCQPSSYKKTRLIWYDQVFREEGYDERTNLKDWFSWKTLI